MELTEEQREGGLSWVEMRYAVDDPVFRTVEKIAFNYLAYTTE
jgi:hypothetical protein